MGTLASENVRVHFLGQVELTGTVRCVTGLHIGGSDDSLQIGGIDKFVVTNPMTGKPYIPGSSLKGKVRSLLEWMPPALPANRAGGGANVYRHECDDANKAIRCRVCRLLGSTSSDGEKLNHPARLAIRDLEVKGDTYKFEAKSENALDRLSAHANPRTNQRVSAGSEFTLHATYTVQLFTREGDQPLMGTDDDSFEDFWQSVSDDLHHVLDGLVLVEQTALGGHGSRGYGKVVFDDIVLTARTAGELVGSTAQPAQDTTVRGAERRDKFMEQRAQIPEFLARFNGVWQAQSNGASA